MARVTIEQQDIIFGLVQEYGEADSIKIEHTNDPYGLVWVKWAPGGVRNLFVKPDGTRLSWEELNE